MKKQTRVKKNRKKYKIRIIIIILKTILADTIAFLVGVLYLLYKLIQFINKMVSKLFMKLPKLIRTAIIYGLILGCLNGVYDSNKQPFAKEKEEEPETHIIIDVNNTDKELEELTNSNNEIQEKTLKVCENEIACKIYQKAVDNGLTYEQSLIVVSISKHETGNWTSKAFNQKNNFGGVMCRTGLRTYSSFEEGLDSFINLLKNNYFGKGLNTIEQIGSKYCPVGATNDPAGINKYWIPNVTKYYSYYKGE